MDTLKLILGASILLLVSVQANAELLLNGGFEEPVIDRPQWEYEHRGGFELTGWESFSSYQPLNGDDPGSVHFTSSYSPVSEGNQAVQIEWPGDWIRQDFTTTIGKRYSLSLDLSARSADAILEITVGSESLVLIGTSLQYETHTFDFIADSALTTLTLTNLGDEFTYPHIDNVSVAAQECDIQLNQVTFIDGDTLILNSLRIANLTTDPIALELKIWLGQPSLPPISVINVGADGSFVLPAGFDSSQGPAPLLPITAGLPRGTYEFSCRLLDPVTGELLVEDRNFFDIQ